MRLLATVCCSLMLALGLFGLGLGLGLDLALARAQDPVLHEFVPSVDPDEVRGVTRRSAPATATATADLAKEKTGPRSASETSEASAARANDPRTGADLQDNLPRSGDAPENAEPSLSSERSAAPNPDNFRPDRLTSLEGSLDYYEAFNPSIAPFKRLTAFAAIHLDADGKTPVLAVGDTRHVPVAIAAADTADADAHDHRPRDRFIGEIDVDFRAGVVQPLPSVSPESRILTLTTQPQVSVQVERDGADNFFLRVLGPTPDSQIHVRWDTDAPRSYFGADLPSMKLRDLPQDIKAPKLERTVTRRALRFASQLGISSNSDLRIALEKLTAHFRNFVESAEPPANTGDLYTDLVEGGKGLCRHRAYGFVVTARALQIDARFVQNEAHSWVEVRLPDLGFVRIDLGGATHGLTAHDTDERATYVPAQPDTLPRPRAYRQSRARADRERAEQEAKNPTPTPAESKNELASNGVSGRWLPEDKLGNKTARGAAADGGKTDARKPRVQQPLHITIDDRRISALRGGKLVLTGRAADDAQHGVPGLRMEVWILRRERQQRMLLAVQVSDKDGYFRADFGVPPDLSVGDYRLLVRSDGDAEHLPATSE